MEFSLGLLTNAVISGLLIGGFYAAVSIGVAISFGMLDIVNIAHPAFILLGSYVAFIGNSVFGIDPILAAVIALPAFYLLGMAAYQVYYVAFERRDDQSLRGLSFFFGLLFITEVTLVLIFGVDYRLVQARYIGPSLHLGAIDVPLRLLVPCVVALLAMGAIQVFLVRSFIGRAILIIIQPVEPSMSRDYIGRAFAICVLGGMGSFAGTAVAAMILGLAESLTATLAGPSWAPAVSFGLLLATLAARPAGLFGR